MKQADDKSNQPVSSDRANGQAVAQPVAHKQEVGATGYSDILDRMKMVAGVKSDSALARVLGINQSSVSSAKERQSIPPAWAMLLSEKFGVSIDWIWLGKGRMKPEGGAIFRPVKLNPYMAGPQGEGLDQQAGARDVVTQKSENIDRDRITMAIQAVEEGLKVTNRELPPDKKASLILAAYDLIEESGNAAKIVELIRIVA